MTVWVLMSCWYEGAGEPDGVWVEGVFTSKAESAKRVPEPKQEECAPWQYYWVEEHQLVGELNPKGT